MIANKQLYKTDTMKVNEEAWRQVKEAIEKHTNEDDMITDVSINYHVKDLGKTKNYLRLNIKLEFNG